jgi:plastocyanin
MMSPVRRLQSKRPALTDSGPLVIIVVMTIGWVVLSFGFLNVIQSDQSEIQSLGTHQTTQSNQSVTVTVTQTQQATSAVHVTGTLIAYTAPFIAAYNLTHGRVITVVDDYNIVVIRNETGGSSGHGELIGFVTTATDTGSNIRKSTMILTYSGTIGNSRPGVFSAIATVTYVGGYPSVVVNGRLYVIEGSGGGGLEGICGGGTFQGMLGPPFTFDDTYYFGASCASVSYSVNATGSSPTPASTTTTTKSSTATTTSGGLPAVQVSIYAGATDPSKSPGFTPDSITVVIGVNNTVTWTNNDSYPHTVTSNSAPSGASFDSGNLGPGASFTFTFTIPGTYRYSCSYHSWMTGTIVVKAGS